MAAHCEADRRPIDLATRHCGHELFLLVGGDDRRPGRLQRIHHAFDQHRPRSGDRLAKLIAATIRLFDAESPQSARFGDLHEIDWMEVDSVFRVAEIEHLLPLDQAERVVLHHHDLHRQLMLGKRGEFAHHHGRPNHRQ